MARFYNLSDNYIVGNPATANQIYGSGGIASYLNDCTIAQLQRVLPPQADRLEVVIQSRLTEYFNWIKGESARFQEQVDQ